MSFNENVEVMPPHFSGNEQDPSAGEEAKKLQKQKWLVLSVTFLIVLIIGLIWVWSRPAIYQSQAIIHFSYAQQLNREQATVPEEQITLNEQRLTSYNILESLSENLDSELGISLTPQQIAIMLSTEAQLSSRIINLYATGEQANLLEPVLSQWLDLYLQMLSVENEENTVEDLQIGEQKLQTLEIKILEQRQEIERFGAEHNIVSLERDENRTLSKIKSLGSALDQAESEFTQSTTTLESVMDSIAKGEEVIHPNDLGRINNLLSSIKNIEATLAELGRKYTPEYMNRDPNIKEQKRVLDIRKSELAELKSQTEQRYLLDLERSVLESSAKRKTLEKELGELSVTAQKFNQRLDEFERLNRSLSQLEEQAQLLKDQLIEEEVQKPFQAKINILEAPFEPSYPISPLYWRDTLIVAASALVASLFVLLLFSFIVRQKQPAATMTSYTVVPPSGLTLSAQAAQQQALEQQQQARLAQQNASVDKTPLQLGQETPSSNSLRLVTQDECKALYEVANREGKLTLAFVLNGLTIDEMLALSKSDYDSQTNSLDVKGDFARSILLPESISGILDSICVNAELGTPMWSNPMSVEQFDQMVINMAHDAGLAFPEQLSLASLRHSYLTFLVAQGARLNDLEQLAGYITPSDLSLYRQVNRRGDPVEIENINRHFLVI